MDLGIRDALKGLLGNLLAGLRLAWFLPFRIDALRANLDQLFLLLLAGLALEVGVDRLNVGAGALFSRYALAAHAVGLAAMFAAAFLIGHFRRQPERVLPLLVAIAATAPSLALAAAAYEYRLVPADLGASRMPILWTAYVAFVLWQVAVILRAVRAAFGVRIFKGLGYAVVYSAIMAGSLYTFPTRNFWYAPQPRRARIDVESTYYAQNRLLERALGALAAQRPGVSDLYFVGFGGYADQGVFMREIGSVRTLFDRRFDTRKRSLVLVNNRRTVARLPLANGHNLAGALKRLGGIMDPREDVLFLYLTSHGAPGDLAVDFPPLGLNDISPGELRRMLDAAGIKWRVIVISACYSGSFIEALRGPDALVITAAARDRTSFGCSNRADYTYFGRAYFAQALREGYSFTAAFSRASALIRARERREKITPSRPQMALGSAIGAKLAQLQRRLAAAGQTAPAATPACARQGAAAACRR